MKFRKCNRKKLTNELKSGKVRRICKDLLEKFETPNPFTLLEDIDDDCVEGIRLKSKIKILPKKQLKKCRYCHHKKRSCSLNPSSCAALNKTCRKCGKLGHYPRSIYCKVIKAIMRAKTNNQPSSKTSSMCLSRETILMIKKRVQEIEVQSFTVNQGITDTFIKKPYETIPAQQIPFLTLFLLLNLDLFCHKKYLKSKKKWIKCLNSVKKRENWKEKIVDNAKYCARKFVHQCYQTNKQYFMNYCINRVNRLSTEEPIPTKLEKALFNYILDVYDPVFYSVKLKGGSCEADGYDQTTGDTIVHQSEEDNDAETSQTGNSDVDVVPQFDGGSDNTKLVEKKLFSINSEIKEIICLMNFFRNCDFLWNSMSCHSLCQFDQKDLNKNCFFCSTRSSFIRLNSTRSKGIKSIKLVEFVSQMPQYEAQCMDWKSNCEDLTVFVANTLRLLKRSEIKISSLVGFPSGYCQQCHMNLSIKTRYIYQMDTSMIASETNIKDILKQFIYSNGKEKCCAELMTLTSKNKKFLIFEFSKPVSLDIASEAALWGKTIEYKFILK